MANKPKPIVFKITEAGRLAVLDAQKQGLSLSLKTFVAGTSKYNASGKETRIKSETMRADIVSSGIEEESKTLRFSATLNSLATKTIHEVGLLTSDNKLFAIAASNDPLFTVYANVSFIGSFGLSLDDLDVSNITVSNDPSSAIAVEIMEDHVAAENPHPQYVKGSELTKLEKKVDKLGGNIDGAAGGLEQHLKAENPHPQYTLKKDFDAHIQKYNSHIKNYDAHVKEYENLKKQVEANKKSITDHKRAEDPHSQYAKKTDLENHENADDPHSQYLQESDLSKMQKEIDELKRLLKESGPSTAELPVGAILTTKKNYKDGAAVTKDLGYGVWKRIAEGMVLVGQSTKPSDPKWTKTVGSTFGEFEHQLTVDELASHEHPVVGYGGTSGGGGVAAGKVRGVVTQAQAAGGDQPHNNVQPSIVVQHWERVS